jgi:hypothetical protein
MREGCVVSELPVGVVSSDACEETKPKEDCRNRWLSSLEPLSGATSLF